MSQIPDEQARLAELEAELHAILREKYHQHWRRKDGKPLPLAEQERLQALQERLRAVFDAIRMIDRKYRIPPLRMHEDSGQGA
ncbi:hypothetical protein FJ251_01205 [bacterium]|nr:hypothetical protein [bacterium]